MKDASKKVVSTSKPSFIIWVLIMEVCVVSLQSEGHYMRVSSRWLVRESDGERTKLACVNWAGHLETMLPEGLNRQPVYRLGLAVKGMGFNCLRLTFATDMFTDQMLSNLTVAESFAHMNLEHSLHGIAIHNPELLHLPIQVAFARVVNRLTRAGLLIILDNHVSKPQWCCGNKDGNGFWGDTFFDADSWLQGLSSMASLFKDNTEVVGMSLRNELRGPKQNTQDWYKYMSLGASAVYDANPNLIIILSGLHYDTDLRFVAENRISNQSYQDKLVYEMHWYAFTYGTNFGKGNLNRACAIATSTIVKGGAFMTSPSASASANVSFTAPLFISEFGLDQRGGNKGHNRFINCFFAFMASLDLDWAYWPLQGSYYLRNGREGDEEFYGILNSQWNAPRNISLLARLQAIQQPWQSGVYNGSKSEYQVLFHPATGLCVQKGRGNTLFLGPCMESTTTHWRHTPQGRLEMEGSYLCIASDGEGQLANLQTIGTEKNGPWTLSSFAKLQFATYINHSHPLDPNTHPTSNTHNGPTFPHYHSYDSSKDLDSHHGIYHSHDSPKDLDSHHAIYDHSLDHQDNLDDEDDDMDCGDDLNDVDGDDGIDDIDGGDHGIDAIDGDNDIDDTCDGGEDGIIESFNDYIGINKNELLVATPLSIYHDPLLCLDASNPPSITTKRCVCVQADDMDCGKDDDPSSQWFVLISCDTHPRIMDHGGASKT